MIKRLLIANRGEIACRILRTAQARGIHCIAIYSDSDKNCQHVLRANEAWHVGDSLPSQSYLNINKIIAVAKQSGADAIHPGYGFLSENADFAEACQNAGIIFIGPPVTAIQQMGSKNAAKALMARAQIPLLAGHDLSQLSPIELEQCATSLDYPVLLKASAGGGGKGMRIVERSDQFMPAFQRAQSEALKSFGDASLLAEKYLQQPRHVEVQVFFDRQGNGIYLFDRDCSIQRRHQKIIEEAPAPFLDETLRKRMGESALQAARCIQYVGAGTVEFLLDAEHNFYFMEMNTRLQVEHPVTEMISGFDLVAWQINIAEGKALPVTQADLIANGHSIEVRLYAENPAHDFLPCTGKLHQWVIPESTSSLRIDSGVIQGDSISAYYDPLLAKVISHGATREDAIQKLLYGLQQIRISGLVTNLDYLKALLHSPDFFSDNLSTHFLEHYPPVFSPSMIQIEHGFLIAAIALLIGDKKHSDPWKNKLAWRLNQAAHQSITLAYQDANATLLRTLHLEMPKDNVFLIQMQQQTYRIKKQRSEHNDVLYLSINEDEQLSIPFFLWEQTITLHYGMLSLSFQRYQASHVSSSQQPVRAFNKAPMSGRIIEIVCQTQEILQPGQAILVMEAMKMEYVIKAPVSGKISKFNFQLHSVVTEGSSLFDFEEL